MDLKNLSTTKKITILSLIIIVPILIHQLIPFRAFAKHRGPEIFFDRDLIQRKEDYLDAIKSRVKGAPPKKYPNIVLILADDLGKTDISLYGSKFLNTPNIDSIGHNGVTFSEAYCSAPVCSPSRAGLLTGRNQSRFGFDNQPMHLYPHNKLVSNVMRNFIFDDQWVLYDNDDIIAPAQKDIDKQGMPPSEILLSEVLQAAGMKTAIIGKWHLGHNEQFIPNNRGFQEQYGFYEAFSLFAPVDDPNIVNHRHDYFASKHIWGQGRKGRSAIRVNHKVIEENEYLTDRIADESVNFIVKNKDNPFFLYVPFSAPHTPFQAKKVDYDKFSHIKDKNKRVYYAMIASLDEAVGRILDKIKELNLENDTIIFFSSDNGGATYTGATDNAPLKGGKMSQFEGGINVPFMMSYGNKIGKGIKYTRPVTQLDIFATSLKQLYIDLPKNRTYDGVDLLPYIKGQKVGDPHKHIFWRAQNNFAVRKGDWKLIFDKKRMKQVLYNLADDKVEKKNVINENPEKHKELMGDLEEWQKELPPPRWPGFMNFRFVIEGEEFYFAI